MKQHVYQLVLTTCPDMETGERIAQTLVAERLAACVNITQPVESLYRWKGKLATDKELVMFIKSTRDLFPRIKTAISKIQS